MEYLRIENDFPRISHSAVTPRASRAAVILFFFIIMVYNTPVYKNIEKLLFIVSEQ